MTSGEMKCPTCGGIGHYFYDDDPSYKRPCPDCAESSDDCKVTETKVTQNENCGEFVSESEKRLQIVKNDYSHLRLKNEQLKETIWQREHSKAAAEMIRNAPKRKTIAETSDNTVLFQELRRVKAELDEARRLAEELRDRYDAAMKAAGFGSYGKLPWGEETGDGDEKKHSRTTR